MAFSAGNGYVTSVGVGGGRAISGVDNGVGTGVNVGVGVIFEAHTPVGAHGGSRFIIYAPTLLTVVGSTYPISTPSAL